MSTTTHEALELIDRHGCHHFTRGRCLDTDSGKTKGARYGADAWCNACIAREALDAAAIMPTQSDVLAWVERRWPNRVTPIWRAAKLGEEAGEVLGAVIKLDEGRTTIDDIAMETAQVVICAMGVAESVGFDLWSAVAAEYERCSP